MSCGYKNISLSVGLIKETLGFLANTNLSKSDLKILIKVVSDFSLDNENVTVKAKEEKEEISQVSRNAIVSFIDQSYDLSFSQFTPNFFKPGLSYVGQVRQQILVV